jgi:hypothetical protein
MLKAVDQEERDTGPGKLERKEKKPRNCGILGNCMYLVP